MAKLTKYEKETIILFNEGEDTASIYTFNAGLKKRLVLFAKKYPGLCRQEKTHEQGGVSYVLDRSRLSIRLQPPMSEERRRKASDNAKQTASGAGRNNVAFRGDMRSKCRVCTRCFDRLSLKQYHVVSWQNVCSTCVY